MTRNCGHEQCCQTESSPGWTELSDKLRAKHLKLTGQRRSLLAILRSCQHPISPQELHARLPSGECDLATVYRSMHALEAGGIIRRYDFGDGRVRFELVREETSSHHHHLVCIKCSGVVELSECSIKNLEEQLARVHGFHAVSHRLEFFGICPQCQ